MRYRMNKFKKILLICLIACCTVACAAAAACSSVHNWRVPNGGVVDDGSVDENNPNGNLPFYYPAGVDPSDYEDKATAYTIKTVSMGGLPIDGVRITIKDMSGETVVEGISIGGSASFGIELGEYTVEYSSLPRGYSEDPEGTIKHLNAETTTVTTAFTSSVITGQVPAGLTYNLGDIMYDFSATDANGQTMVLSQILQNKRAVLLNFWATWCAPCRAEFPIIDEAYNQYKDKLEVIAISTTDQNAAVKAFKEDAGYSFFMSADNAGLSSRFDTSSIPVSVMIDRYGVISYLDPGAVTNLQIWLNMFETFTADNYEQSIQQGQGGDTGEEAEPVKAPDGYEMPSDDELTRALLDPSMAGSSLHFYEPAADTRDGIYNWPFKVADDPAGAYITPSNTGKTPTTDNTWSIVYTDVELEADQTLSIDVRVKSDPDDILYISLNNSAELTFTRSGDTGGWETITLLSSTRYMSVNIAIFYIKNYVVTDNEEFVGVRNLKVADNSYDSDAPLDVRTEAVKVVDGKPEYPNVYKAGDGFYHIQQGETPNEATDSMLFADILAESQWSDLHLANYTLVHSENGQSVTLTKSLYLISYWHVAFGDAANKGDTPLNFQYGTKETDTVIDNYWIQDGTQYMSPVNDALMTALKAFAKRASEQIVEYEGYGAGEASYNENTWLELCSYYRTLGGDHSAEGHSCLAHYNPGTGKTLSYAIDTHVGERFTVDLTNGQKKNRAGGLFFKFTAPEDGVYKITSFRPYGSDDPIDPSIIIWPEGSDAYNDPPLLRQDDCHSLERYARNDDNIYTNNIMAYIYLTAGQTIYPQLTVEEGDISQVVQQYIDSHIDVTYEAQIDYVGATAHILTLAGTDGTWESMTKFNAVPTILQNDYDPLTSADVPTYHHLIDGYGAGSEMFIDFIHPNYMAPTSTIEEMLKTDYFDLGDVDYTSEMKGLLEQAKAKDPDDLTYGMLPATDRLVRIISAVIQNRSDDGDGIESGAWEGFAYYWQYYGPTVWEPTAE